MTGKPIGLYWWRREGMTNLGDELSRDIVEMVSGRAVYRAEAKEADMLAIGSIITFANSSLHTRKLPYLVWGSGSIDTNARNALDVFDFSAVRGPLTYSVLGPQPAMPFGDPGILTSVLWPHSGTKTHRWGIIPHFRQIDEPWVKRALEQTPGSVLIDVRNPDIEATCRLIASCEFVASTSLHGLVIADSYHVPNQWLTDGDVNGTFKYWDYFAGIGRPWVKAIHKDSASDLTKLEERLTKNRYFGFMHAKMKRLMAAFPI